SGSRRDQIWSAAQRGCRPASFPVESCPKLCALKISSGTYPLCRNLGANFFVCSAISAIGGFSFYLRGCFQSWSRRRDSETRSPLVERPAFLSGQSASALICFGGTGLFRPQRLTLCCGLFSFFRPERFIKDLH